MQVLHAFLKQVNQAWAKCERVSRCVASQLADVESKVERHTAVLRESADGGSGGGELLQAAEQVPTAASTDQKETDRYNTRTRLQLTNVGRSVMVTNWSQFPFFMQFSSL